MSSSSADQAAPKPKAPKGWSNEPELMYYNYYWTGDDSITAMLATSYGLKNAKPQITRKPEYGDVLFLFEAPEGSGSYYVWNGIERLVCEIVSPKSQKDIYARINEHEDGRLGGLAMKELKAKA